VVSRVPPRERATTDGTTIADAHKNCVAFLGINSKQSKTDIVSLARQAQLNDCSTHTFHVLRTLEALGGLGRGMRPLAAECASVATAR
jgi:hypothetical protein